jgi:hypothetical protein
VEYYPFKNLNLYFFGSYVWRSYQYTDYAELGGQLQDYNRSRFMIGFISPLLVL